MAGKDIIRKYSDFVHFPIYVNDEHRNRSRALWTLPKSQVTEEQHAELFRHVTGGGEDDKPLLTIHWSVDAPVQFHALLYVPEKAPHDLFHRERKGLRLYAKRVLIMEDCDKLTPAYLRFLRGVVDSEDLSLNVSREMLQENKTLTQIEEQIVKQTLKALKELAESDPEKYLAFYREYGRVLKEGIDPRLEEPRRHRRALPLRVDEDRAGKLISLKRVRRRDARGAEGHLLRHRPRAAARWSRARTSRPSGSAATTCSSSSIPIDEWVVKSLANFDKKALNSVAHGDLDLGEAPEEQKDDEADVAAAVAAAKKALGDRVKDVRVSKRLTDSASVLVADEGDPGANFERILRMVDQNAPAETQAHPRAQPRAPHRARTWARWPRATRVRALGEWAELLLDQALLAEGVVRGPGDARQAHPGAAHRGQRRRA